MGRKNLNTKGLTVSYDQYTVLTSLDLKIRQGEFVTVVGESGCGKTTLLNAIAGFIEYEGDIIRPDNIGVVFQNYAVFPWMTVEENIRFGLKENGERVRHYMDVIGITDKSNAYPFELSGGQIQRVALARTLAACPDLILMDEPYGALDVYTRDKMQQWLLDVWSQEKKTILFVTHSIEEAIFLSDRVMVLKDRKIKEEFHIPFERPRNNELKFDNGFNRLKKRITDSIITD